MSTGCMLSPPFPLRSHRAPLWSLENSGCPGQNVPPAASAQIPQGLGGVGRKDCAAGCVLERPGHLDLEAEYRPCCLLAVGSQPGTIITVAPYAKHLAISCFHQPRGRQGKGTAERCTQQLEGGEAQQSVGLPELSPNKQIKAT